MQVSIFQLHKKAAQTFNKIEDAFGISDITGSIAIADGATQGYFSGLWAKLIATEFVVNPTFKPQDFYNNILLKSLQKFNSQLLSIPSITNRAINILSKDKKTEGAYTTFLGIQISGQLCNIICCGDCNLFYLPNGQFDQIKSYPFNDLMSLNTENSFINTEHISKNLFDASTFKQNQIQLSVGDHLYLTTDAVSRYFLNKKNEFKEFACLTNFEEWLSFAESKWKDGSLENDDLTVIKIIIDAEKQVKINAIIPPQGFSFNNNNFEISKVPNMQELENVENKISYLKNDLNELKKKIDFKQSRKVLNFYLLLTCLILIISFISFISYYNSMQDMRHLKEATFLDSTHKNEKFTKDIDTINSQIEKLNSKIERLNKNITTQQKLSSSDSTKKTSNTGKKTDEPKSGSKKLSSSDSTKKTLNTGKKIDKPNSGSKKLSSSDST